LEDTHQHGTRNKGTRSSPKSFYSIFFQSTCERIVQGFVMSLLIWWQRLVIRHSYNANFHRAGQVRGNTSSDSSHPNADLKGTASKFDQFLRLIFIENMAYFKPVSFFDLPSHKVCLASVGMHQISTYLEEAKSRCCIDNLTSHSC
jgi:hypothetical protein